MAKFRFINEAGQDDTGRVATYVQREINLDQWTGGTVIINPIEFDSTFHFSNTSELLATELDLQIAQNNKSKIGDRLTFMFNLRGSV